LNWLARLEARMAPMQPISADSGLTEQQPSRLLGEAKPRNRRKQVKNVQCAALAIAVLLVGLPVAGTAQAQKQGGILRVWHRDSPGNMSILAVGTAMLPAPEGLWAMPKEMMEKLPGYDPDVQESREEARKIMQSLGYGPDKRLSVKISARNLPIYRDPATILSDQLKQIWIDTEIELVETANWLPRLIRGDFTFAQSLVGSGLDDPDQNFYENYICDSNRNYTKYCNRELDKLIDRQSMEPDQEKRKHLVWQIDSKLQEDVVRPILYHMRQGTCWRPELKGLNLQVNSIYNGWRMEDVWLDR
jgi:ABC-type transport system substrate-binding protein